MTGSGKRCVQPKPDFGSWNRNQGPILVQEPNFGIGAKFYFSETKTPFFQKDWNFFMFLWGFKFFALEKA